ncbi:MAG: LacI family DNA-binding transcriptional regulator [Gammaproteobacteria bacterium]|nr:LacI family DNA-binding transcriptional regulator [Gammaproteobacteria bacterium]MDH5302691.1 LacI family DNA-binding transcriptional regulator [Gammaproteobacteria bacterium]MDH5320872.1 LacI family DNA-binding transcriptional regulator [Gammaproteobacteria bacterium]
MRKRRATIEDVASLAGVSIKTVSRVVNREPNVRASTTASVKKAITKLDYRPNPSARNLASHRARLIVLVYDDPSTYDAPSAGYIIKLQEGALRACRSEGFELLIHPCSHRDSGVGAELQEQIRQIRPSGIVVAAPLSNLPEIVDAVKATNTPYVRLSTGTGNGKQYEVATNDRDISAGMTRYLAELGHTRIAFIRGDRTHLAVGNRFWGYRDGLEQCGLPFAEELVVEGDNSIGSGEKCAEQLLQMENRPTAIFAANDDMAAGVVRAAARMRIGIPDQLSVAGCDDISLAQMIFPALTTIRQPLSAMAHAASKALIDSARGRPHEPGLEVVPGEIIIRESTGPVPRNA